VIIKIVGSIFEPAHNLRRLNVKKVVLNGIKTIFSIIPKRFKFYNFF